jgi:hypothetical protein
MSSPLAALVTMVLLCSASALNAKPPNAILGAGAALKCRAYTVFAKDQESRNIADMVLSWAQGYFSARNSAGLADHPLAVGGSLSSDTFKAMLVDECNEESYVNLPVFFAVEGLYDKMKVKGL